MSEIINQQQTTLVLGATGKTGRRVAERLTTRGLPVRLASRSGATPFDWEDRRTWAPALHNVKAVYLVYYPDLSIPQAAETVRSFARLAVESGVERLVLLSGRGEEGALASEQAVKESGAEWTIVRASWFFQNFSEGYLLEPVIGGEVVFPAGNVTEPFIDCDERGGADRERARKSALRGDGPAVVDLCGSGRRDRHGERARGPVYSGLDGGVCRRTLGIRGPASRGGDAG